LLRVKACEARVEKRVNQDSRCPFRRRDRVPELTL
jgi:hypothetical protein